MPDKLNKHAIAFLYTGFSVLLAASIILAFYALNNIENTNKTYDEYILINGNQFRDTMNMRVAIRERAILLLHMSLEDDFFERDELYQRFYHFGAMYQKARNDFISSGLSSQEKILLSNLDKETTYRAPILRQLADTFLINQVSIIDKDLLSKTIREQSRVSDLLDKIINLQLTQNKHARLNSEFSKSDIIINASTWMIIIIIALFLFARKIINSTKQQHKLNALSKKLISANQQLEHKATHDELTGLFNRLYLQELLEQALSQAKRYKRYGAILFIDLDNFKPINDNYGHLTGDAFLATVSTQMKATVRDSDIVARIGGDEFVVLLSESATEDNTVMVASKLLKVLSAEYTIEGNNVSASASIGICFFNGDEDKTADELLKYADDAMYQAKQSGKNKFSIYRD